MTTLSIPAALRLLAERDPGAAAVRDDSRALTRFELIVEAERWAALLSSRGVLPQDRVGIRLPNSVDNVAATVGVWVLGATPVPFSARLAGDEQRALVELGELRLVVGAGDTEFAGCAGIPLGTPLPATRWSGPDLVAAHWKIVASGGSTGRPKLVVAAADATVDPDRPVAPFVPQRAVQLVVAPLSHSAPFTYAFRGLMTGHSLVLLPRFEPAAAVLAAVEQHRVTWMMLVPTMMSRMLRLPDPVRAAADLTSLDGILHIGAPCAPEVKRGWIEWIGAERVVEVYAGSESAGLAMIRGDEWLAHPGSVGRGVSGSEFRVVNGAGEPCPPGTTGLIQMRRGEATYSYVGAEARVDDDAAGGWHTLGDLGWIDGDGYLFVVDREDDLIITGAEKVHPIAIEQAAESIPGVRSAVAVGIRDADLGQAVGLVLDTGDHDPPLLLDEARVIATVVERAGRLARPRAIHFVNEPLRDDAGKVRRRAWREVLERR